jgi:GT2 family glycosyltransferase
VSLVAVTFGTGPIITDSLVSLVESLADSGVAYEYLVVDNAHPDAGDLTVNTLCLSTSGVRVVRSTSNLGFGGGCDLGVRSTTGEILAFVNPDVMFEPGWIAPLLDALREPTVSISAPVLLNPDRSIQEAGQRLWSDGTTSPIVDAPASGEISRPDYASAACWLMRRDEYRRLGGFDPAYFPAYYEDVDFALRALSLGGSTAVVGDSQVVHRRGSSTADDRVPDTTLQRQLLLDRWPDIATTRPTQPIEP